MELPSYPEISTQTVRAALGSLLYFKPLGVKNPLENLVQVDDILANPDLPRSPQNRSYALQELLISIITKELTQQRNVLGCLPPNVRETLTEAYITITGDAYTSNPELIGWSWLYYHYVRFDLHISSSEFAKLTNLDERTLRRYQAHALSRFTCHLIQREKQLRQKQRQQKLYAQLPTVAPLRLFGRECEQQKIWEIIHGDAPHHIQITGSPGIGKTSLVQEVIRKCIDAEKIDYLIWVNTPNSVDAIRQYLERELLAKRTDYTLRDYAAKYRLAIVLDNIELLRDNTIELENLLDDLSTELVFVTNDLYMPLKNVRGHVYLTEISQSDTLAMSQWIIKDHYRGQDTELLNKITHEVWASAGGNPFLIQATVHLYELEIAVG